MSKIEVRTQLTSLPLVSLLGLTPLTLRLSYSHGVENNGFEPLTPCVQSRCSSQLS